jgi:hypothetical protein
LEPIGTNERMLPFDGWLSFNHVVILKADGRKTCGNFPFVQQLNITIL